jgi:hypothetical protein
MPFPPISPQIPRPSHHSQASRPTDSTHPTTEVGARDAIAMVPSSSARDPS